MDYRKYLAITTATASRRATITITIIISRRRTPAPTTRKRTTRRKTIRTRRTIGARRGGTATITIKIRSRTIRIRRGATTTTTIRKIRSRIVTALADRSRHRGAGPASDRWWTRPMGTGPQVHGPGSLAPPSQNQCT